MYRLEIAQYVEKISNVKDQRDLVDMSIQHALDRFFTSYDFPYYLQDKGVIKTTDNYNTGTVSATNGSATITGSGTTFTASMVGRKIRINGENPFYRIKSFTSTTEITLEQPYQGDTDTGLSYEIYQDEYRLASDVDKYKTLRQLQNNFSLFSWHPFGFDNTYPMPQSQGDPLIEVMEGTLLDTYTTGTVSGTINTSVLTGASTEWASVEGLGRMSKIIVPSSGSTRQIFTVKSVDSDTQITVYENIATTIAASTSYQINLSNLRVQLHQIPDAQRLIYYRYFRIPEPLTNDYSIPDMPLAWHWLLIYGALSMVFVHKGDIQKAQNEAENRFIAGINQAILKIGSFSPDRTYHRKSVDRISRGINDGIEEASFDRKYSLP